MQDDPNGGDWFDTNAPPDTFPAELNALYQRYYGRDASAGEIASHRANPGGLAAVEAMLKASQVVTDPGGGGGGGGGGTGGGGGGTIGVPTSGFGAAPPRYNSDPNAPTYTPLPTYQAPEWTGGDYVNPTEADLLASPGYQSRLDAGLQARNRSAAAQGTVLNGGTLKALDRYGQDYASNEYQTMRNNTLEAYKQRYGQFQDKAGMDLGARTLNANENQNSYMNRTNQYLQGNNRTLSDYLTNLTAKRNSELDYWNRLQDVNQTGAGLAGGSR